MAQAKHSRSRRDLSTIYPAAAAIDIGAKIHVAAVNPDRDTEPVQTFQTFTDDLNRLADWFARCGIKTVAMESTGVYWIPVFEILEQRGFEVMVVNARDAKHVPGRKTDVSDAEWLQRLHEYGLLRPSFRPQAEIAGLRAYLRQRERLLDYAAAHIQHMQKALTQMNLQLHHVVSDITGVTGMTIIRAIVAGERDPNVLASHRERGCHASVETICQALVGNYREEHLFALTQAVELYDVYQTKVTACDKQVDAILKRLENSATPPASRLLPARQRTRQPNAPAFDARAALHAILGVDLTRIHGLGPYLALKLVGECGTNLTAWPTAKHFTSWLGLAPHNKISGGKVLSSKTRRTGNRAASMLRLAATSVGRTDTALGAFYRRLSGRVGKE
jgi:transposase